MPGGPSESRVHAVSVPKRRPCDLRASGESRAGQAPAPLSCHGAAGGASYRLPGWKGGAQTGGQAHLYSTHIAVGGVRVAHLPQARSPMGSSQEADRLARFRKTKTGSLDKEVWGDSE